MDKEVISFAVQTQAGVVKRIGKFSVPHPPIKFQDSGGGKVV